MGLVELDRVTKVSSLGEISIGGKPWMFWKLSAATIQQYINTITLTRGNVRFVQYHKTHKTHQVDEKVKWSNSREKNQGIWKVTIEQGWRNTSIGEPQGIEENTDNVTGIKLDNFSVSKPPRKSEEEQGQNHTDGAQWKAPFSSFSKRSWTEKFIGSRIPEKETWVNKDGICSMLLGLKTYKSNKKQGSHFYLLILKCTFI